jgi:hypothetical protein
MEEKGEKLEKVNCACGSVVLKKNLASHIKTKKHQALAGPPSLHRSSGVSFADAQHTDRADVDDSEDGSEDGSEDDELEEGDELDELFGIIEELTKAVFTLDKKLDTVFDRVEETRLKMNSTLGEVREIGLRLPFAPFGVVVKPTGSGPSNPEQ